MCSEGRDSTPLRGTESPSLLLSSARSPPPPAPPLHLHPGQDIREMTVRHITYGAKAEDVGTFAHAFVETVERLLGDRW